MTSGSLLMASGVPFEDHPAVVQYIDVVRQARDEREIVLHQDHAQASGTEPSHHLTEPDELDLTSVRKLVRLAVEETVPTPGLVRFRRDVGDLGRCQRPCAAAMSPMPR